MSFWLYVNILFLLIVIISIDYQIAVLPVHIFFGLAGLFLVLFNWTRHAFFSTIRHTTNRQKKIRLAAISKKIMPFHRWIGSTALVLIIAHVLLIINKYGFLASSWKMVSGMIAGIFLLAMVATGWLRYFLPSGGRRKAHMIIGFLLFFSVVIHTLFF